MAERIVYKDCETCHGKGWHEVESSEGCLDTEKTVCADCAFKNGAEAMRAEIVGGLECLDKYFLTQPPLCMCDEVKGPNDIQWAVVFDRVSPNQKRDRCFNSHREI